MTKGSTGVKIAVINSFPRALLTLTVLGTSFPDSRSLPSQLFPEHRRALSAAVTSRTGSLPPCQVLSSELSPGPQSLEAAVGGDCCLPVLLATPGRRLPVPAPSARGCPRIREAKPSITHGHQMSCRQGSVLPGHWVTGSLLSTGAACVDLWGYAHH